MKDKIKFTVVVGNVGSMDYISKKLALECFETYKTMSELNLTRAAGEDVTLFEGETIIKEHIASLTDEL